MCNPRVSETLLQSWDIAPDTSVRTSLRPTQRRRGGRLPVASTTPYRLGGRRRASAWPQGGAAPLRTWRRSGRRSLKSVGGVESTRRDSDSKGKAYVSTHLSCPFLVCSHGVRAKSQYAQRSERESGLAPPLHPKAAEGGQKQKKIGVNVTMTSSKVLGCWMLVCIDCCPRFY